jgi:hypothetical protein
MQELAKENELEALLKVVRERVWCWLCFLCVGGVDV